MGKKKAFYFWLTVLILLVLFLPSYTKLQELKDRNRDLEAKIIRLQQENTLLEGELKRIGSDPFYQEKITREKIGVVRKDEIPVRVVPEDNN